jgi:hypothetical protein
LNETHEFTVSGDNSAEVKFGKFRVTLHLDESQRSSNDRNEIH